MSKYGLQLTSRTSEYDDQMYTTFITEKYKGTINGKSVSIKYVYDSTSPKYGDFTIKFSSSEQKTKFVNDLINMGFKKDYYGNYASRKYQRMAYVRGKHSSDRISKWGCNVVRVIPIQQNTLIQLL